MLVRRPSHPSLGDLGPVPRACNQPRRCPPNHTPRRRPRPDRTTGPSSHGPHPLHRVTTTRGRPASGVRAPDRLDSSHRSRPSRLGCADGHPNGRPGVGSDDLRRLAHLRHRPDLRPMRMPGERRRRMNDTNEQAEGRSRQSNTDGHQRRSERLRRRVSCLHSTAIDGELKRGPSGAKARSASDQRHTGLFLCHTCEHPNGAAK